MFNFNSKGKIIITGALAAQINRLHEAHQGFEWSGPLLFTPINVNLEVPEEVVIRAEAVFPMDFGSSGYTEYDLSEGILELYEKFPQADPSEGNPTLRIGQLHSHHSMPAFFSGTDDDELVVNAGKYDYYVSLIVCITKGYVCKLAFVATLPETENRTNKGILISKTPERDVLAVMELAVEFELPSWYEEKIDELNAARTKKFNSRPTYSQPYNSQLSLRKDDEREYNYPSSYPYQSPYSSYSKKDEGKEKTSETKNVNFATNVAKSTVRAALPFLFLEDEEQAAKTTFWLMIDDHPLRNGSEADINEFVTETIGKIDSWLQEHFAEEIIKTNGYIEESIMTTMYDVIKVASIDNPLAIAFCKALETYIEVNYKTEGHVD
jgi:hypothetical protein